MRHAPIDRESLTEAFAEGDLPEWTCPKCTTSTLGLKPGTFLRYETAGSRAAMKHEAADPSWTRYIYTCLLVCSNFKCKELVACSGTGTLDSVEFLDEEGHAQETYIERFRPRHFEPHLVLFDLPANCPARVSAAINESFNLFFSSPSAAGNSVRIAIEALLTALRVKRTELRDGGRVPIPLHRRIKMLPAKFASVQSQLMAIKWIGNAGSHGQGALKMGDVLTAYELTSHVLDEIYASRSKRTVAIAKIINKKKGPI